MQLSRCGRRCGSKQVEVRWIRASWVLLEADFEDTHVVPSCCLRRPSPTWRRVLDPSRRITCHSVSYLVAILGEAHFYVREQAATSMFCGRPTQVKRYSTPFANKPPIQHVHSQLRKDNIPKDAGEEKQPRFLQSEKYPN